jgi:hypothetical protein
MARLIARMLLCPCPPPSPVWPHLGNRHGSTSGAHYHQIIYNQNPKTCCCNPRRMSEPTPAKHEMSIRRFFVGYDARPVRNPVRDARGVPDLEDAADHYSVDDRIWPSLWSTSLANVQRPAYVGPVQNLWEQLSELQQHTASALATRPSQRADADLWRGFYPERPASVGRNHLGWTL